MTRKSEKKLLAAKGTKGASAWKGTVKKSSRRRNGKTSWLKDGTSKGKSKNQPWFSVSDNRDVRYSSSRVSLVSKHWAHWTSWVHLPKPSCCSVTSAHACGYLHKGRWCEGSHLQSHPSLLHSWFCLPVKRQLDCVSQAMTMCPWWNVFLCLESWKIRFGEHGTAM